MRQCQHRDTIESAAYGTLKVDYKPPSLFTHSGRGLCITSVMQDAEDAFRRPPEAFLHTRHAKLRLTWAKPAHAVLNRMMLLLVYKARGAAGVQ
jgi:hypothetical protein